MIATQPVPAPMRSPRRPSSPLEELDELLRGAADDLAQAEATLPARPRERERGERTPQ